MSIADLRFEYNIGKRHLASYLPIRVMYHIVCKFWWERGNGEENGFHIWPRKEDLEVVEGKA